MTASIRRQASVSYRTLVKRTLVNALKEVFDHEYPEKQFKGLRVSTEYPLTRTQYPAIYVRLNDTNVYNAGVGHVEMMRDPAGNLRRWSHRRFVGSVDLVCVTLSTLDRDILADALVDLLSFAEHDPIKRQFFDKVYGDPTDVRNTLSVVSQIALNTDDIRMGGDSATIAPWQPEDVLVYTTTVSLGIMGGFYNSLPVVLPAGLVSDVSVYPYIAGERITDWRDRGTVVGHAQIEGIESGPNDDSGVATGVAHVSSGPVS